MFADNFNQWNRRLGWFVFFIALLTYGITVEPTGSFWDAGEYISTSAKLQVGHPPGAPLLQMLGAFFAMFAFEATDIAKMVNYVSGVSSAFTILFLFWIITNLGKKLIGETKKLSESQAIALLGSGLVGALTFTFSDSFWFNALETEVYASASLIMSLLLWLGLKWTDHLDTPRGNRWLILIWFVIGLTFGVQFMGFLAIPSIGLLFYFKKYKTTTTKNFLLANVLSVAALMLVYKFSLTYILKLFGWAEVYFVNNFGLPFNSGTMLIGLAIIASFFYALKYTRRHKLYHTNTIVLCAMFLILGFSSWFMLPIRANAGVIINENNPEDARSLLAYYNREQYPGVDSPIYGAYYSNAFSMVSVEKDDKPKYEKNYKTGKYEIVNEYKDAMQGADPAHKGLLPRMWSETNAEQYMKYFGPLSFIIKPEYRGNKELIDAVQQFKVGYEQGEYDDAQYVKFLRDFGDYIQVQPPTLMENLYYMFTYQFNYMYWRYFMWNYVGKQDDVQGKYDLHGNWLSGIGFIDAMRLGSQDNLPSEVLNNKGRNTYFFLPLLLGLIGLAFQFKNDKKQFWVLLVFFLFSGLAIQFYTNPPIFQPRERDYSLVGSFFIFAIWVGLGVYGLFEELQSKIRKPWLAPATVGLCALAVPALMGFQNWDDHDRSNRYTARSTAMSYLDSTSENTGAILFTIGDNDTFPLWFVQEIEGYRTDVRIVNSSLIATDWYMDQMKRKAYSSDPVPSQLTHDKYKYGTRDAIYYQGVTEKRWSIQDFMNWVASDKPQTKFKHLLESQGADTSDYSQNNLDIVYYPTNKIRIPVNKENVLKSGIVKEKDSALIVDYIDIDLPKSALGKNRILMLDILANNDWERPIYFSGGSFDPGEYLWLKEYLQLDGMAYKLVPIKTINRNAYDLGRIDSDLMYQIVMNWDWGNSGDPDVYLDTQTRIQGLSYRGNLARLTETLIQEGKTEKAKDIVALSLTHMPIEKFGFYTFVEPFLSAYYELGDVENGRDVYYRLRKVYQERLSYYAGLTYETQYRQIEEIIGDLEGYRRIVDILITYQDSSLLENERTIFNDYVDKFKHFYQGQQEEEEIPLGAPTDTIDLSSN